MLSEDGGLRCYSKIEEVLALLVAAAWTNAKECNRPCHRGEIVDLPVDLHDPCYLAADEAFSLAPRRTGYCCGWGLVERVAGRSGVCYREEVVHASMLDAKTANKEKGRLRLTTSSLDVPKMFSG